MATKTMQIFKSPYYLTIHLKKLKSNYLTDIESNVIFPVDLLDLNPYVIDKKSIQSYDV